jgi:DNA-binding transcriptional LysR family regulator
VRVTLDDLRVFVAVCRAGSLSAVARDMGCTQSAVSQHVKRLEKETRVPLLERQPRGVVPTAAGRVLWDAASDGLAGLDLALRRLGDLVDGGGGAVRVTTGGVTVRHFMAEAIVEFRRHHPGVSLEFRTETSSRRCFDALLSSNLDLAWITIGEQVRGIEQRPAVELPWVLAVREGDLLAGRSSVRVADLADLRLVRLPTNSTSGGRLDVALAGSGLHTADSAAAGAGPGTSVADWDTALLLAELGVGHAVVPELPGLRGPGAGAVAGPGGPLRLVPIPELPPLQVGWAVRRWDALPPQARAFADTVVRALTR